MCEILSNPLLSVRREESFEVKLRHTEGMLSWTIFSGSVALVVESVPRKRKGGRYPGR